MHELDRLLTRPGGAHLLAGRFLNQFENNRISDFTVSVDFCKMHEWFNDTETECIHPGSETNFP